MWGGGGGAFFFFNDTATTEIYTLSLHDALPISEDADALHHTFHHYKSKQQHQFLVSHAGHKMNLNLVVFVV